LSDSQPSDGPPPGYLRIADLLSALSLAADLGIGLPAEHAVRSCYLGMRIADRLQVSLDQQAGVYYAELLMDAGCTAWTSHLARFIMSDEILARREFFFYTDAHNPIEVMGWLKDYVAVGQPAHLRAQQFLNFALHGKETTRESFRTTCEVAGRFAERLGMPEVVQTALVSVFEQWDGSGPGGIRGEAVPLISRIVYITSFLEAFHHAGGRTAAIRLAEERRGKAFDPTVVGAFLSIAGEETLWEILEQESVWTIVLAMEPASAYRYIEEEKLEDVALSFADFADLKSFYSSGHSRRVGDLAERLAMRMRPPGAEVAIIRRAALMHDLGLVAVPSFILQKPRDQLTPVEWERLRLHPYHAERILARVPVLAPVVPLIAAHHERLDGHGYYRGLSGAQIPLGARIIAVADRYDELTHDTPDEPALDQDATLQRMTGEVGAALCPDAFRALAEELRASGSRSLSRRKNRSPDWPAGLTDREVEILRLLSKGLHQRELAVHLTLSEHTVHLTLSEHTVRHHLEHIYNKVGVSTRVGAVLFAVEHDLLR
jgi:HD-GYP domain-containing protein (c-di-GMP phosphodiesterase class II)/DNA-binding CsgD family transcriptional regulator